MKLGLIKLSAALLLLASCGGQTTNNANAPVTEEPVVSGGERLFINNCVQCHAIKKDKLGPKLEGALARWNNDTTKMIAFIHNSQEVINSGSNPYATKLYKDWSQALMPPFTQLSDADVRSIIEYIAKGVE